MEFRDYYQIMGVARDATQDEIKRAYRRLARKYHPDVSKESDAESRFKELGEAYEVLKDPEKRAAYDQLGKNWQAGQDFQPPPNWDAGFEFSGGGFTDGVGADFSDFFESLFGRGFQQSGPQQPFHGRGEDHHAKVLIDLEDTSRGAVRTITLQVPQLTPEGHVRTQERTIKVRIPKGVRAGQRIRLAGQGATGIGEGPPGDLYLEVEFKPHPLYRVDGKDLYIDLPIAPWEAALGATVSIPTLDGKVDMKIPAGSQSGRKLRLKGRGLPGEPPGDQYAVLLIRTPPVESAAVEDCYRKLAEASGFDPREGLGV